MAVTINVTLANFQVDAWADDLNSGFIDIYTTTQPADPDDSPVGTLLVSCALSVDAYSAASGGIAAKIGTISGTAVATGTAGYAQQRNAANTRWMYGSVTATGMGGDVELDTTTINTNDVVSITTSTITQPQS